MIKTKSVFLLSFLLLLLLTAGSFAENEPSLIYSTYLGGEGGDDASGEGVGIVVDTDGNIYITGPTDSPDFPVTFGAYDTSYNGNGDVFVVKFNSLGELIYSTFLGGSGYDYSNAITIDSDGSVYITGGTNSSDFPTTFDAYDAIHNGGDAFIIKLNSVGTELVYSTFLGGTYVDYGEGIAVDEYGDVYITGYTGSSDFPTSFDAHDTSYNGNGDGFATKINFTGTELIYSTYLGGSGETYDTGEGIAVDAEGNAYVTGGTHSWDFPVTSNAYDTSYNETGDAFVAKFNPAGTELIYSTFLGGWGPDVGHGITIDADGNAYITGFASGGFPTTYGAYSTTHNGWVFDAFVTKINPLGTNLVYSTFLGGNDDDWGFAIAIDEDENAYITGHTYSSNFPTTPSAYNTSRSGGADVFAAKINSTGRELFYSTYLGGSDEDFIGQNEGVAVDENGNIYVVGSTKSSDFPVTPDAYDTTYNGNGDIFVAKIKTFFSLTISDTIGGTTDPMPDTYIYDEGVEVTITAIHRSGYKFSRWSGDAWGTSNPITVVMDANKSITAHFTAIPDENDEEENGCFIATAAYGSFLHPHVKKLRDFRDKHLMTNKLGRKLVKLYYKHSPRIADLIRKSKTLKAVVRTILFPLVILS